MSRCSLFIGQEYTEAEYIVFTFICLVCLFWFAIFVFVCLIIKIIEAPTEVAIRKSIALESHLFSLCLTHLFLTTSLTCSLVTISLSSEVLFLCCLLAN